MDNGCVMVWANVADTFAPRDPLAHPDMEGSTRVIGVMSGSSLDGIDLALCEFKPQDKRWSFSLEKVKTVPYDDAMHQRLLQATEADALELARLHRDIGIAIGNACKELLTGTSADAIASHGHTIFHQPDEGLTTQVGDGARIAAMARSPTVCDFRTMDVALGGQGAPLVPFGERVLFPEHKAFVNLGGIANISIHQGKHPLGYDICPCNQALDMLAREDGKAYDEGGALARSGEVDLELLAKLNALPFYQQKPPRSLGREWFDAQVKPLISSKAPLADRLRTVTEHIALLVAGELDRAKTKIALITGGGAHNTFLIERIGALGSVKPELPAAEIIDYKEALIFAFLGMMRLRGEVNILSSVTGAARDSIGGAVYLPN